MRLGLHGLGDEKAWGLAMLKVRFTPQAITDLAEIKRYISGELFNPQAATDLVTFVFAKTKALGSMPQMGVQLRTDIPMLRVYRFIRRKNYLVFYRIDTKYVSIIRILYARRDYFPLLPTDKKCGNEAQPGGGGDGIPTPHR
jgi:plasmid stabilization system protein ParE